ncbi:MAG: hypothetical protein FD149_799 [Rhodospirillaceae bacterium]|nr:MAG: hypothetical protein FD149_799 [Rhodospirillaceae bacterium]
MVEAYVPEEALWRLEPGTTAVFLPDRSLATLAATVTAIDRTAVRSLPEPALAAPLGGPIPAHFEDQRGLVPDGAVYRVHLTVSDPVTVPAVLSGVVHMDGARESFLGGTFRAVAAVVIREWGP